MAWAIPIPTVPTATPEGVKGPGLAGITNPSITAAELSAGAVCGCECATMVGTDTVAEAICGGGTDGGADITTGALCDGGTGGGGGCCICMTLYCGGAEIVCWYCGCDCTTIGAACTGAADMVTCGTPVGAAMGGACW